MDSVALNRVVMVFDSFQWFIVMLRGVATSLNGFHRAGVDSDSIIISFNITIDFLGEESAIIWCHMVFGSK